jgi:hypothetical protein
MLVKSSAEVKLGKNIPKFMFAGAKDLVAKGDKSGYQFKKAFLDYSSTLFRLNERS